MRMARAAPRAIAVAALALVALLVGCVAAPGSLMLDDETGSLERAALEAAATPLLARGARVVIIVAARGDETGADLAGRLDAAGLLEGGQVAPDALVLYVSYAPRYSELRAGTRWSRRLPATALREARTTLLNPALRDDQLAQGLAATLQALEARIASPPLSERLQTGLSALVTAGVALAALALSPLGAWLGHRWRRTPPGRLAQWLGDQTPPGRRRLERIIRTTRLRMEDRATFARSWCKAASGPRSVEAAALMARLRALDQERAALSTGARQDRALEEALDRLARAYEALGHEASRLAPARPRPKPGGKKAAASAFTAAPATTSGAIDSSSSDSPSTWDSGGSSDSGPSSDGGSW
jgi:uncharacterized membrane protein YgcG